MGDIKVTLVGDINVTLVGDISVTLVGDINVTLMGDFMVTYSNDCTCEAPGPLVIIFHLWPPSGLGQRKCIQMSVHFPRWPPCPYWASVSLVYMITLGPQGSDTGPSWSSC